MRRPGALACSLAGALVLLTASAVTSALAAPPTAQQLEAAQAQMHTAQQRLSDVQVRAEQAAEAYNGAILVADRAAAGSATAAAAAAAAAVRAGQAQAVSAAAALAAEQAQAAADAAQKVQDRAVQEATAAQAQLNDLINSAYRSGGSLELYSSMLTHDPLGYVTAEGMVDRADQHQKKLLDTLDVARTAAAEASRRAAAARTDASTRARQESASAQQAHLAADQAQAAAADAAAALRDSSEAATRAELAKRRALGLVAAAQQQVGVASATSASLAAQAAQARRDAQALAPTPRPITPVPPAGGAPAPTGRGGATAVAWAFREIGVPYSWGGGNAAGPTLGFAQGAGTVGFDCSGLTLFAWAHAGVPLGHYTGSQWTSGRHVATSELSPGDLVFFATNTSNPDTIHHVGIYIGGGNMISAPHTGDVVRVASVAGFGGYIGAVRPGT